MRAKDSQVQHLIDAEGRALEPFGDPARLESVM